MTLSDAKDLLDRGVGRVAKKAKSYATEDGKLMATAKKQGKNIVNAASNTLEAEEYTKQGITPSGFHPARGAKSVKNLRVNP